MNWICIKKIIRYLQFRAFFNDLVDNKQSHLNDKKEWELTCEMGKDKKKKGCTNDESLQSNWIDNRWVHYQSQLNYVCAL